MSRILTLSYLPLILPILFCGIAAPLSAKAEVRSRLIFEDAVDEQNSQALEQLEAYMIAPSAADEITNIPVEPAKLPKKMVQTQKKISSSIVRLSQRLDHFFSNERSEAEIQETYIKLNLVNQLIEGEIPTYNADVKTRFVLPQTQKKLGLILESVERDFQAIDENRESIQQSVASKDLSTGVRFFVRATETINLSLDSGILVRLPLDPFARLRARRSWTMKNWELRLTQSYYWYHTTGEGANTDISADRQIDDSKIFRFRNLAHWRKNNETTNFEHSLNLYHTLSDRQAFSYSVGINSVSRPVLNVNNYFYGLRYRHRLFQDWLFGEITPLATYPREKDFIFVPSLTFKLEVIFGAS